MMKGQYVEKRAEGICYWPGEGTECSRLISFAMNPVACHY